jgi:hypothetical protein
MRLHDGRYECALCGEVLDITETEDPLVTIRASSGQPNRRSLSLDGHEIHSCVIGREPRSGVRATPYAPAHADRNRAVLGR